MQFAINYSPQAAELFRNDEIPLDVFKSADWPDMVAAAQPLRPVYVHFPLQAGQKKMAQTDWDAIYRFLDETDTLHVNAHLNPPAPEYPGMGHNTEDPKDRETIILAMLGDIAPLVERFGSDRVILENAPWNPCEGEKAMVRWAADPDLISQVVRETNCGFLLDIGHARRSVKYFDMAEHEYLERLPVERICELHVSGLKMESNGGEHGHAFRWRDHYGLSDEDFALTEWAIEQMRAGRWACPWVMTLEYGGTGPMFNWRSDPQVMAAQVPRLYELAHSADAAQPNAEPDRDIA